MANGFLFSCTRFGGFMSQFLGVELNRRGLFLPYYVIAGLCIIAAILTAFLPHDTHGHHLDTNIDQEESQKLILNQKKQLNE